MDGEARERDDRCDELVALLIDAAIAAHPAVQLDRAGFAAEVAALAPAELERLHASDLYVAHGCAAGDAAALAWFERALRTHVRPLLARHARAPDRLDEAIQATRAHLLVRLPDGGPPRIARYRGRGPLAAWIAVAAQRLAIEAHRRERPTSSLDEAMTLAADLELDREYAVLRDRDAYRRAIAGAIAELDRRDRLILRMSVVEGVSHERIAAVYRVNQSTVSRWIARAQQAIGEHVARALRRELGLSSTELASLTRLVRSQLDLSLGRLLAVEESG